MRRLRGGVWRRGRVTKGRGRKGLIFSLGMTFSPSRVRARSSVFLSVDIGITTSVRPRAARHTRRARALTVSGHAGRLLVSIRGHDVPDGARNLSSAPPDALRAAFGNRSPPDGAIVPTSGPSKPRRASVDARSNGDLTPKLRRRRRREAIMKKRQDAIEEAYAAQVRPARYRPPGGPISLVRPIARSSNAARLTPLSRAPSRRSGTRARVRITPTTTPRLRAST